MSDGVHIEPDTVESAAGTVLNKGNDMKAAWDAAKPAIGAAETGIGHGGDKLVQAFQAGGYGMSAQRVSGTADTLPTKFIDHGNTGRTSAEQYREADRAAAGNFPR